MQDYVVGLFRQIIGLLATASLIISPLTSSASLPGNEDFGNERIVPLLLYPDSNQSDGSGFLYSSRIVFTSAHTAFSFNDRGELVDTFRYDLSVGKPNSNLAGAGNGVRVVKRFMAPGYVADREGDVNDFAVLVLEKDLLKIGPAKLMTPEIERELVEKRASVTLHGYGMYVDACSAGQQPPCRIARQDTSQVPRSAPATLRPAKDFPELVGYALRPKIAEQLLFFSPGKTGMCAGDSGGSLTTIHNGELTYLSVIGTGDRTYGCGFGGGYDGRGGVQFSPPIYRYLDLIKKAEAFVAEQVAAETAAAKLASDAKAEAEAKAKAEADARATAASKKSITCVKGKQIKKVSGPNPKCPKGYKKK